MKIRVSIVLGSFVLASLPQTHAAVLVSDNFDSYADQAAFVAAWPVVGVQPSGTLSTMQSVSSPNSVNYAITTNRNERSFTESGNPAAANVITFSLDFYDSNDALSPYRQYANLQDSTAPSGTSQLISLGLNNNQTSPQSGGNYYMARILGYAASTTADPDGGPAESVASAGAYFKLNDFGVGLRSLGWHNLKVVIGSDDGLSTDYGFYVDNVLAETVSNVGTAATLRSYDVVRLGSGLTSTAEAFIDNVNIATVVPEPSTVALSVLGGVALCLVLIRRRK